MAAAGGLRLGLFNWMHVAISTDGVLVCSTAFTWGYIAAEGVLVCPTACMLLWLQMECWFVQPHARGYNCRRRVGLSNRVHVALDLGCVLVCSRRSHVRRTNNAFDQRARCKCTHGLGVGTDMPKKAFHTNDNHPSQCRTRRLLFLLNELTNM